MSSRYVIAVVLSTRECFSAEQLEYSYDHLLSIFLTPVRGVMPSSGVAVVPPVARKL
jgi:hypothetical protein